MCSKKMSIVMILLVASMVSAADVGITIIDIIGGSKEIAEFKKVDEGELISFQVVASDGSDCIISNLPKGATYQNNVFTWTPDAYQAGMYPISFHTGGPANLTYKNIRIVVANRIFNILAEQPFEYLFMAMDPDDDDVEITITGLPAGATFTGQQYSPKLFQWTPTLAQLGTHIMTLTATDNPPSGPPLTDVSTVVITVTTESSPTDNPYDFNEDNYINEIDLALFANEFLTCVDPAPSICDPQYMQERILKADGPTVNLMKAFIKVYVKTTDGKFHITGCKEVRRLPYFTMSMRRAEENGYTADDKFCDASKLLEEIEKSP